MQTQGFYHVYVIDLGEKKSSKMNSMKNIEIKGFEPENFSEESAEKGESCSRLIKVREKSGPWVNISENIGKH